MGLVKIAIAQGAFAGAMDENIAKAEAFIREAAAAGAQAILLPELFQGPYPCRVETAENFAGAYAEEEHPVLRKLAPLAGELEIVLPLSFFERERQSYYNSIVIYDADGSRLGLYRKSHIPDGPGYEEKFYFTPGNTGFKAWRTRIGMIGVGICWDQWFPEAARTMALMGADLLLYPTAIGNEPHEQHLNTSFAWRLAQQGHAVSNHIPVAAANRIGNEDGQIFYGTSFICGPDGSVITDLGRNEEGIATAELDFEAIRLKRASWGFFRDRRPELYGALVE